MAGKKKVGIDACLSDDMLVAFHLGDLPEAELDSVRRHQESCPRCEARACLFDDRTDALLDDIRMAALGTSARRTPDGPGDADPTEAAPLDLPDYVVCGPPIGAGSMGVVYKARHLKLDRLVALKMIARKSSTVSALFQAEAKAIAQLQHPNIVQIFDIGHHRGQPFLALEFVEGGSLDRKIAGRAQPPRAAAEMIRTLALASDYAHRHGIVHCDLKPSNILITTEGVPKIADFGVAKWLESDDHWSKDGDILGTPRYMAPEQASGKVHLLGPATDVYSLGVILHEMLTGRPPGPPATAPEAPTPSPGPEATLPSPSRARVPRDLEIIVLKCLREEPAKRYADAAAVAEDLGRFLQGSPIRARPVGMAERAFVRAKRHPAVVSILAITTLFAVIAGAQQWRYSMMVHQYHSHLKVERPPPPILMPGNHPGTIVQSDGSIRLGAAAAVVSGNSLVFEAPFGNLGYWHGPEDRATWTFRVDHGGTFVLALDYSNFSSATGNEFQVQVGDTILSGKTVGTGSWTSYRALPVGTLSLPAGIHRLEVRPSGTLKGALFDLRAVILTPR